MRFKTRTILRLSGHVPDTAPEQKASGEKAASVFRRFFSVLTRLERKERLAIPPRSGSGREA
jgi:hypothetical protein